uniref:Putative secreted protein n=1 Tax=Anopheles darlingi TaxID=43151 RepID=A0A2M4D522_ANODA
MQHHRRLHRIPMPKVCVCLYLVLSCFIRFLWPFCLPHFRPMLSSTSHFCIHPKKLAREPYCQLVMLMFLLFNHAPTKQFK